MGPLKVSMRKPQPELAVNGRRLWIPRESHLLFNELQVTSTPMHLFGYSQVRHTTLRQQMDTLTLTLQTRDGGAAAWVEHGTETSSALLKTVSWVKISWGNKTNGINCALSGMRRRLSKSHILCIFSFCRARVFSVCVSHRRCDRCVAPTVP